MDTLAPCNLISHEVVFVLEASFCQAVHAGREDATKGYGY